MSEWKTEDEFAQNLNTVFRLKLDTPKPVELTLIDVKGHSCEANEPPELERFSAVFSGPADFFLPQRIYPLAHQQMGDLEIFLVPIGKEVDGFRYEAVFNYFKSGLLPEGKVAID